MSEVYTAEIGFEYMTLDNASGIFMTLPLRDVSNALDKNRPIHWKGYKISIRELTVFPLTGWAIFMDGDPVAHLSDEEIITIKNYKYC